VSNVVSVLTVVRRAGRACEEGEALADGPLVGVVARQAVEGVQVVGPLAEPVALGLDELADDFVRVGRPGRNDWQGPGQLQHRQGDRRAGRVVGVVQGVGESVHGRREDGAEEVGRGAPDGRQPLGERGLEGGGVQPPPRDGQAGGDFMERPEYGCSPA